MILSARLNFTRGVDEGHVFDAIRRGFPNHRIFRAAYAHTAVVIGAADAMVDAHNHVWDVAPSQVLIEEAGGAYAAGLRHRRRPAAERRLRQARRGRSSRQRVRRADSGNAIALSALLLREALTTAVARLDPEERDPALRQMVLTGHSQGGLSVKMQGISTGDRLWNAVSREPLR